MPPSWRAGLVNAFPIPDDKRKKKKRPTPSSTHAQSSNPPVESSTTDIPPDPFPFLSLPPEIRTKIYHLILFPPAPTPFDVRPKSSIALPTHPLSLLRVSRLTHSETTHLLYTRILFPLFPLQTFPPLPTPLLIPPRHRPLLKSLTLRLGNSWSAPPKSWRISKLLARAIPKFTSLRILKVFVEIDPSEPMFEKYRVSKDFYTDFAGELLRDVLAHMTQLEVVEVGGNDGVNVAGPLVRRVVDVIRACKRVSLVWSDEGDFRTKAEDAMMRGMGQEVEMDHADSMDISLKDLDVWRTVAGFS